MKSLARGPVRLGRGEYVNAARKGTVTAPRTVVGTALGATAGECELRASTAGLSIRSTPDCYAGELL